MFRPDSLGDETAMIRALYDWALSLARSRHAERALAIVSFVESSFFPIPPDVMLAPMVLADRARWVRIAAICTVASVLGALLGYAIGALAFEWIGQPLLAFYGKEATFADMAASYNDEWGVIAVLAGAVTFLPYKVFTIFSGVTGMNIALFVGVSIIGRGFRFFAVAWLISRYGEPIQAFIERRLGAVFAAGMILLVGGFAAIRYL